MTSPKPKKMSKVSNAKGPLSKARVLKSKPSMTLNNKKDEAFPLVAIGASAGGLEALEAFFTHVPSHVHMAFIVITHLDRTHHSLLPQLLQRTTQLQIVQIAQGMKVQPGFVYVIPPNKKVIIDKNVLKLLERKKLGSLQLPINDFFQSLAKASEHKLIAIILSGAGMDGTLGIKAIHQAGGLVMAQDPDTAKFPSMPRSAIDTGLVDCILAVENMPQQLLNYINENSVLESSSEKKDEKIPKELPAIFHLLRTHMGHDFSLYKHNTICRRIQRRMDLHKIPTMEQYTQYLRKNVPEIALLFKDLLIKVTGFFRNPEAFEKIKALVLDQLIGNKPRDYCLRLWVPACATGEEAYSLAILIQEYMDQTHQYMKVQIFGSDISDEAIEIARAGAYPLSISQEVNAGRLKRFFKKEGKQYRISKTIREMVIFAKQNIIKDPPFTKLDMISCRNFFIYLKSDLQRKLIDLFHYSLNPNGVLFLGSSENIANFTPQFKMIDKTWKIFSCKKIPGLFHPIVKFDHAFQENKTDMNSIVNLKKSSQLKIGQHIESVLLQEYTPACVVIDENDNVVYLHGKFRQYLEPTSGLATLNILQLVCTGLKEKLSSAMRQVALKKKSVSRCNLLIKSNGKSYAIDLMVRPFEKAEEKSDWKLIIIEEFKPLRKIGASKTDLVTKEKLTQQIVHLEHELKNSKENIETSYEEMETFGEELKSSNEEMQSINEELQSTNEELESSKEELQSLNEELTTVNAELESRIEELSKNNDDIQNLFYSTGTAVIFLDNKLNIKRFTPKATELISLIQTDIGRPISHIVSTFNYQNLVDDANQVLDTLSSKTIEVQSKGGQWYQIRIMPYRTLSNIVDGVIINFVNIDSQKKAEILLEQLQKGMKVSPDFALKNEKT